MINKIAILGAGNVSHHFVKAFVESDYYTISQVYSRNLSSVRNLAQKYGLHYTDDIYNITDDADLYLFLLSDTGIREVVTKFPIRHKRMAHSSGSISINIFENLTDDYAVFYPFQTFRKEIQMDFSGVPVCIEASNKEFENQLTKLANDLSCKYYFYNSEQRIILHLAAVFACNFMNHSVHIGEEILKSANINPEIIKPLLRQSFNNILNYGAGKVQTGPAIRNDKVVINNHLSLLKKDPELQELYAIFTNSIQSKKS